MSGLNILQELKSYFESKKASITRNIIPTVEGCRKAADNLEEVSGIENRVFSAFEGDSTYKAFFNPTEPEEDPSSMSEDEDEEEFEYDLFDEDVVFTKMVKPKDRKRKAPIMNRYGSSEPDDDSDSSGEDCGPEYTNQQLKDIYEDLSVLDNGTMQDFRMTGYGQLLFYGIIDQIGAQTGHQTENSRAEEHVNNILNTKPGGIVSVVSTKKPKKTKCYLCDIVHNCTYVINMLDDNRYYIGSHCAAVVDKIIKFTDVVWEDFDPDDIEEHVKDIDTVHTELLEAHFNKKSRRKN